MTSTSTARVDMHCHSTASEVGKLGIQRSMGLPECATPPEEVYELAKRRGMDFVTITDHDTIDGCLEIVERPDVFVSEELTTWFKDEPQAVHVLCYGITPHDHEFLQEHARDLETCAAYLHEREITCALAHPFFSVAAPLEPRHRRRLAELFGIWEVRNGSRARELNMPAALYIDTHGGIGIGGSDDHAGVDIGRTWTETPAGVDAGRVSAPRARRRAERPRRAGQRRQVGAHGARAGHAGAAGRMPSPVSRCELTPAHVMSLAERVVADGEERGGEETADFGPAEGRALLRAWLESVGLDGEGCPEGVIAMMQADDFSHSALYRRARRIHERRLAEATEELDGRGDGRRRATARRRGRSSTPACRRCPTCRRRRSSRARRRS